MNPRARQLLGKAHEAYVWAIYWQRRGYAFEQQARKSLVKKPIVITMPVISPVLAEPAKMAKMAKEEEMQ